MIEVKIETDDDVKVYEFPENWDEVTVEKFCNVYRQNYDNITEFEGSIYLLSALSGFLIGDGVTGWGGSIISMKTVDSTVFLIIT